MKILVLGAGLVGGPMAIDLCKDKMFDVSVADIDENALNRIKDKHPIEIIHQDLSVVQVVRSLCGEFDIVVNAVPGFMGYQTLQAIIDAGKNVVDIAFFPEDAFQLNTLAKEKGVSAIVDCGVAPGMSNILIGYVYKILDHTNKAVIYVGGLPKIREWPYEYKAVFSPIDVIEEYTRPARIVEDGKIIIKPALSEPEMINFSGIGTLEAFNSDGLRSLANTMNIPNMIEKTLRYPGHVAIMKILRDTGFFSEEFVEVKGKKVRPIDVTSKVLFPKWKLKKGEVDITIMRVIVEGEKDGQKKRYTYQLRDQYDPKTGTHSMARVTGYTATMAVRLLASGKFTRKGIIVPEFIGENPDHVNFILNGLKERGVAYRETIEEV